MKNGIVARIGGLAIGAACWLVLPLASSGAESPPVADEQYVPGTNPEIDEKIENLRLNTLDQSTALFEGKGLSPFRAAELGLTSFFGAVLVLSLWFYLSRKVRRLIAERTNALQAEVEDKARALDAHVESEERFRALIEQASDGIFIADPDWRLMDVNNQGCAILGSSHQDLLARSIIELFPRYELPRLSDELESLHSGEPVMAERNMQRADGTLVPIEVSIKKLADGRLLGIFRDISKRKQAEEVLREREVQYRRLVESANAIPYEFDVAKKRFSFVGPQAVAILGYPLQRWFEDGFWLSHIHPDDRDDANAYTQQAISAGIDHSYEYRMRHQKGHYTWLRDSVRVVMGEEGPTVLRGFLFDVTERRLAEEAQRESEERYRVVAKTATDAIITVDSDFQIVFANPASETIFGYERHDLIGQSLTRLVPAFLGAGASSSGVSKVVEVEGLTADGVRFPLEVSFGEMIKDGQVQYTGIFRDITQRKNVEEERKRMETQMQHTQKLESLGVLAGGIAHDFNNLLVGILGHAEIALMDIPMGDAARPPVEEIGLAARRAADLTNQMLAFSGKGKFIVQTLGLNHAVEEMNHLLRTFISKRAQLSFNLSDQQPAVVGDPSQIRQVLMNLITNASDALGDANGEIKVSTGVMSPNAEWLQGAFIEVEDPEARYAFIQVEDSGCGMDDETQRRIFDPFFTTKFTGRGLGLAAVLGIVRGHKGAIKVISRTGKGTAITVLFPLAEENAHAAPEPVRHQLAEKAERKFKGTVLLVDDDETVRLVGRTILQRYGFTVFTAADGAEGVDVFSQQADNIDVVILDMTMPNLNGEEAYREMCRIRPNVRAILSSGYSEQEATSKFSATGLAGFIQKPYLAADLTGKISEVLGDKPGHLQVVAS